MLGTHQRLHLLDYAPETIPFKLVVNDYEIRKMRKAKYLGLIVDENLTWEEHIRLYLWEDKKGCRCTETNKILQTQRLTLSVIPNTSRTILRLLQCSVGKLW